MFTPEYLSDLVESTSAAATDFNMYLTNKVIDSVINLFEKEGELRIIPSNQHRINLLQQSGILVSDIAQEIRKRLPGLEKKIREAFYKAGYEINEDINKAVSEMVESDKELKLFVGKAPRLENLTEDEKRILDAAYKRTNGEIRNLTRTTAADINQQFLNSCDSAWWKAKHGVDAATAIREAIDEVSKYGSHVIYRHNGKERKMSVESAIRMCVLTGINQANTEITLSLCASEGIKNVLVSSHMGARYTDKVEPANHESWQGKVYTVSEKLLEKFGYQNDKANDSVNKRNNSFWVIFERIRGYFQSRKKQKAYEDLETVTGYGTIEGLCGINCRHTFEPFYPGMTNNQRQYDSEENKKAYDLSQKKRSMERQIRDTKKRLYEVRHAIKSANNEDLISELKSKEAEIKSLFDKQNSTYSAFCRQNGLRRSEDRLYVSNKNSTYEGLQQRANTLGVGNTGEGDNTQPHRIGDIDPQKMNEAISYFGNQIRNSDVEHVYIIDDKGRMYYNHGTADSVSIGNIDLANCHVLHNHPASNGIMSFGKDDFMVIKNNPSSIWHLVNEKYDYDLTVLKPLNDVVYNQMYLKALETADIGDDIQDLVMKVLAEGGYIKYAKRKLNS